MGNEGTLSIELKLSILDLKFIGDPSLYLLSPYLHFLLLDSWNNHCDSASHFYLMLVTTYYTLSSYSTLAYFSYLTWLNFGFSPLLGKLEVFRLVNVGLFWSTALILSLDFKECVLCFYTSSSKNDYTDDSVTTLL